MALNALKIQTADLVGKLVAQLSNRPTNPVSSGGDNLTAQEVKERYDAYGHLLKERFNALVDALVADPAVDTDALANTIQVYLGDPAEEDPMSLSDALALLFATLATKYALPEGGIPAADLAPAVTTAIDGKYVKPGTGIPATDLETAVQTSLGKADTAYQKPSGGIPATDLASAVKAILESAVSQSEFAPVKALAENADKVLTAANYEAVATMLNAAAKTDYKVGQKILIGAGRVPDLWIYFVHDAAVTYTYTTGLAFQTALENGTLQIGYYALRPLEAKTELEDYPTKTEMNAAIANNIDATLSTTGKAADAKAVGDAIDALIDALVDGVMAVAEATYAESATYAQQAGIASQINTDREIEDADTACPPVVFGTVGGNAEVQNGLMKFPELRGHTIKWNQLVKNGNFANPSTWWNVANGSYTVSDNIATFTASAYEGIFYQSEIPVVNEHKVFVKVDIKLTSATDKVYINYRSGRIYASATTSWQTVSVIGTASSSASGFIYFEIGDARSSGWDAIQIKNVQIFDITEIYGSGNEPSTVAEFVRDFPKPYYAYNAGTLLSSKSSSVDFIKRNQWDEEWEVGAWVSGQKVDTGTGIRSKNIMPILPGTIYYCDGSGIYITFFDGNGNYISRTSYSNETFITDVRAAFFAINSGSTYGTTYNHDICIYINWNTPGLPYVPCSKQHITLPNIELRSIIGTDIWDVAYQQGGGKRRVGTVDLGTLNWGLYSQYGYFYASLSGAKGTVSGGVAKGCFSEYYKMVGSWGGSFTKDLQARIFQDGGTAELRIRNDAYTDAATFKAAMSGVMLYYELATETDITTTENPGWTEYAEIDNFGTVKFNQDPAQDIPVPQAYFVRYTVNLVEFLDSVGERAGFDASKIALLEDIVVPDAPTTDGSYTLKVTVSSGTPTYTWVADE